MPIDVAINGAAGRMGRMLTQAIVDEKDLSLVVALEHSDSEFVGQDAGLVAGVGEIGVPVVTNRDGATFDVLVDFSIPVATLGLLDAGVADGFGMVIGTSLLEKVVFIVDSILKNASDASNMPGVDVDSILTL